MRWKQIYKLLLQTALILKNMYWKVFAHSIETNQSNDLRDTKYLHNIISNLENVIKSKDQIINLLRNDMKTLQDQLNVNESNTWKSVSSISHKNYKHKTQAENSNCGIITFNRFTPLAPDIHTPNKNNTTENDVQNVTDNSITNNTNNTSEMERPKKSRKVSGNAVTPYFVNKQKQQQQQQQNRLFFNNHPGNDMRYNKILPGNTSYSGITQSGKKAYIFGTSMVSNVKAKKLNNKLRRASARIRDFKGATIKHLKHHVLPNLVDDTPDIPVIHGGCSDFGYKNTEALSAGDIVNAIPEIGKLCQSHGVIDIFISSLTCRKNNFQNSKVHTINNLLRSACDLLRFHFIDNSSIARNHLAGDGIHLNNSGTEVLLENIAFCLNNFL